MECSDWLLGWALLWLFGGTQAECVVEGGASLWSDLMQRAWGYIRKTWVWVLVLLHSSCVTLVKGCNFSRLQLLSSETGLTVPTFQGCCENSVPDIHHLYHMLLMWQMLRKCYFPPYSLLIFVLQRMPEIVYFALRFSQQGPVFLRWLCGVYLVHLAFDSSLQFDIKQQLKDSVLYLHLHWLWPTKLRGVGLWTAVVYLIWP